MIKLWVDYRSPFYVDRTCSDGSIDLSRIFWFYNLSYFYNPGIGMELLNNGYKI